MGASRRASFRRKRPSTKKIYRRLKRRPAKVTKYTVAKNAAAVRQLKTVVNQGPVQRNLQRLKVTEVTPNVQPAFTPETNIFFAANDFIGQSATNTVGGLVYMNKFIQIPGQPGEHPQAKEYAHWIHYSPGYQMNLPKEFRQWTDPNIDTASFRGYMPLSARFSFNFRWASIVSSEPTIFIRFDILKRKKHYARTDADQHMMPQCGGVLSNMAVDQYGDLKNQYNPELWTVKTFYKTVPSSTVPRSNISTTATFNVKFPRKYLDLKLETTEPNKRELFYKNCPLHQQIWVNINISRNTQQGTSNPVINATRQILYRDAVKGPTGV